MASTSPSGAPDPDSLPAKQTPSVAAEPVRFRLEVGTTELRVTLRGDRSDRMMATVDERMCAFVDLNPSPWIRTSVDCDWTVTGEDWQPFESEGGAEEPIATRRSVDSWWVDWCYYRMHFSRTRSYGHLTDWGPGLEHALRGAAVFGSMPHDALFFHAATLVFDGEALLLAGSPNAGKSTIAREGAADRVLSNEISIVARHDGRWWALPSPFWGTGDLAQRTEPAPLRGVVVLSQAPAENEWRPLTGMHATAAVLPHAGIQARAHANEAEVVGAIADLTSEAPTFSLAWHRGSHPLNGSKWRP